MKKTLAASNKVMKNYLSELMTDDELPSDKGQHFDTPVDNQKLEKLLNNVSLKQPDVTITTTKSEQSPVIDAPSSKVNIKSSVKETEAQKASTVQSHKPDIIINQKTAKSKDSFQAMFFKVAGLTVAVPLVELGGIHSMAETTSLVGKPNWFKGVMLNRDEKINVVDTALWVMPEKCNDELLNSLNYQYIIMLNDSQWGLTAEHLIDTVTLNENDVKWLDSPSKRPWLAGLVKERMCALLDVEALIQLLNDGVNIRLS